MDRDNRSPSKAARSNHAAIPSVQQWRVRLSLSGIGDHPPLLKLRRESAGTVDAGGALKLAPVGPAGPVAG
jgi:hypothetical protein